MKASKLKTYQHKLDPEKEDGPNVLSGLASYSVHYLDQPNLNYLLNDKRREELEPVIQKMFDTCPEMMARKIPRANVQQAFVLDTATKLLNEIKAAKPEARVLSVGSYEDTATETLSNDVEVFGIDPAINMDLATFFTDYPTARFDLIISTSVIEHVPDDERFIQEICQLLHPGGYAVLTCDYRNDWKEGDVKPGEDQRLYTEYDLLYRLNNFLLANSCALVGKPDYSGEPDFDYEIARYSFATYVFKKLESVQID